MKLLKEDVIVIGTGPAGYSAALYLARSGFTPIMISGNNFGGQLMNTTIVDNWIGEYKGIMGPDLMNNFEKHVKKFNIKIKYDFIKSVDFSKKPLILNGENNKYSCKSVIIATGSKPRFLQLKNEKELLGNGVSTCATCDGYFFKNKEIAIVGGGDSAAESIIQLAKISKKVTIIHRRENMTCNSIMRKKIEEIIKNERLKTIFNSKISKIFGSIKNGIQGIEIINKKHNSVIIKKISALFIAIGHIPNSKIFKNQIKTDENGYILNFDYFGKTSTSVEGVFSAGDVSDKIYRQAITSAGSGCMAALDAERYLNNN